MTWGRVFAVALALCLPSWLTGAVSLATLALLSVEAGNVGAGLLYGALWGLSTFAVVRATRDAARLWSRAL